MRPGCVRWKRSWQQLPPASRQSACCCARQVTSGQHLHTHTPTHTHTQSTMRRNSGCGNLLKGFCVLWCIAV